jgi:hypothetical protein
MSEYQYYEFQAIDRPLSEAARKALRDLSTRARITATTFTNSYEWGDFKGNPNKLMENWFDLHLYLANWGSRRLMIRLPKRLVDRSRIDAIVADVECVSLRVAGENLIVDIDRGELEFDDWDDGAGWLAALAPLRADLLAGDVRLFYLLWLTAVEDDGLAPDQPEPLPGIGPMSATLQAFAAFFGIDPDLVQAASERPAAATNSVPCADDVRRIISSMSGPDTTAMLSRVFDGDPHVAAELRVKVKGSLETRNADAAPVAARTVGELRARAKAIGLVRAQAAAQKRASANKQRAEAAERARQARLLEIEQRGEGVWREIEAEIERRNATAYDKAACLLLDLQAIAEKAGTVEGFRNRLQAIRGRHARKERFIERLTAIGP